MALNIKKRFNKFLSDWDERLKYDGYTYKELCSAAGGGDGDSDGDSDDGDDGFGSGDFGDGFGETGLESGYDAATGDVGAGGYDASDTGYGGTFGGADDPSFGDTSGDFTTESFEGGTVSYNQQGDYSVTNADGTTHGFDSFTGISYETATGGQYGVTATNAEGTSVTYDTLHDMQAEIEANKLATAKKAGMAIGAIFGPAGMVVGYYLGGVAYEAINPEKVSETLGREQFSEEINAAISENDVTLTQDEVTAWQSGEDLSVGSGGDYTVGTTPVTGPSAAPITEAEVQSNYLDYMKERQEAWDEVFGPVQDNLSTYYQGLTPESLEAREISAIQQSYQQQSKQLEQTMAQRGIGTSGLTAAGLTQLTQATAQDKAVLRATAPQRVAEQQLGFLKVGLGQEAQIQQGISSAYTGALQTDIAGQQLAAQQSAAASAEKSAMYGALATAVTAFM